MNLMSMVTLILQTVPIMYFSTQTTLRATRGENRQPMTDNLQEEKAFKVQCLYMFLVDRKTLFEKFGQSVM